MKRTLLLIGALALVSLTAQAGAVPYYGWSLSESNSDPCVSTGTPSFGVKNVYLWHTYATDPGLRMAAADITIQGSLVPLAFNPENGYLNAGSATAVLLAVGGCPMPPIRAGFFIIIDTGGNMVPGGARLTVDCVINDAYESGSTGWSSDGSPVVEFTVNGGTGCTPTTAVEGASWGSVKNLYR